MSADHRRAREIAALFRDADPPACFTLKREDAIVLARAYADAMATLDSAAQIADDTLECTYTNRAAGSITVEKITDSGKGSFDFTSSTLTPSPFTLTTTDAGALSKASRTFPNLDPGTYEVYSRSEQAWGVDDSGTMQYFVRFTQGDNGAAIGFHDIPVDDGALVQTVDQLGTPQSHGCIRQAREDAIALWEFAPIGTEVDVTA